MNLDSLNAAYHNVMLHILFCFIAWSQGKDENFLWANNCDYKG